MKTFPNSPITVKMYSVNYLIAASCYFSRYTTKSRKIKIGSKSLGYVNLDIIKMNSSWCYVTMEISVISL